MHISFVLTTADSEDPAKMPHNVVFHQGLHCLLRQKRSPEKKNIWKFGNCNLGPLYLCNRTFQVY